MEQAIVQWVRYDNKLKEYNDKCKVIRTEKDKLKGQIMEQVTIPDPSNPSEPPPLPQFNIEALGTSVKINPTKTYEAINLKFLTGCLREYFNSEETAKEVVQFIQQKRTITTTLTLKRNDL